MFRKTRITTFLLAAAGIALTMLHVQFDFNVAGRDVQIHSFASQGFMCSNVNNYMSTNTSSGSFSFTDFGFNAPRKSRTSTA